MDAKYQRIRVIGTGAFGKAYLVKNTEADQLCVVKQMETASMDAKERDDAVKEAVVLKKMQHPNIIQFQEIFMTRKGKLCIVMEYADGGDLSSALKSQAGKLVPEAQVFEWFVQVCFSLHYVHQRKVLHRDLKGQNIFLMASGQTKLGDFGIARVLEATKDCAKSMVGTPYYLSPEIIQEKPYAFKSDVWSLGVVLYEMVSLKHPFEAESLVYLAQKILKDTVPDPDAEMYSANLSALIRRMLSKDDSRRPTIVEILRSVFLQEAMQEANKKYDLGLDLSEFSAGAKEKDDPGKDEPSAEEESCYDVTAALDGDSEPDADAADERKPKGEGVAGKAAALRKFLCAQMSAEQLKKVCQLVKSFADGGRGDELQAEVTGILGDKDKTKELLPMVQLLCFLDEVLASSGAELLPPVTPSSPMQQRMVETFQKWDLNKDGVICQEELRTVLKDLGLSEADVEGTFKCADANHDGKIDYKEFIFWLFSDSAPTAVRESMPAAMLKKV
eukprot:TRINITY_DN58696_c0_g1_i1.p1 TRINITY_DN58696_c0_g1~~TRINITY_DN58696_c0_g1_i1.p1  ORF type:complete len:502 (-),score=139.47 TRINITY_DN58696_c0_g1_i1:46-1551(-)